jgi:hypothetical protein
MTAKELREEINIELELIEAILAELVALSKDVSSREPTVREKTAAAAFMSQFYGGVENILKRISHYYSVPLPTGDAWHIDLFKRFCAPSDGVLPVLLNESLSKAMAPYRKFRHLFIHGYGFQIDWNRMQEGIKNIEDIFSEFKHRLSEYMQSLH